MRRTYLPIYDVKYVLFEFFFPTVSIITVVIFFIRTYTSSALADKYVHRFANRFHITCGVYREVYTRIIPTAI